jgi:hypothetical protein
MKVDTRRNQNSTSFVRAKLTFVVSNEPSARPTAADGRHSAMCRFEMCNKGLLAYRTPVDPSEALQFQLIAYR